MHLQPYYQDASATIYHGDALELLPHLELPDDAAIISDPPYGISHQHPGGGGGKHTRRNTQAIHGDNQPFDPVPWLRFKTVVLFGADHFAQRVPEGRWLIWDKLDGLESFDSFSDVEIAWQNRKGASRIFRYLWKGICQAGDKDCGREHPSQKPMPLMRWCIEQAGSPALVVDPYCGVGTTLRAAKELNLKSIGIEIDERYCEIAARKLQQEILNFA